MVYLSRNIQKWRVFVPVSCNLALLFCKEARCGQLSRLTEHWVFRSSAYIFKQEQQRRRWKTYLGFGQQTTGVNWQAQEREGEEKTLQSERYPVDAAVSSKSPNIPHSTFSTPKNYWEYIPLSGQHYSRGGISWLERKTTQYKALETDVWRFCL